MLATMGDDEWIDVPERRNLDLVYEQKDAAKACQEIMTKVFDHWDEDASGTLDVEEILEGVE
jgi:hypothetical protein